jgi:hypothetical protein
MTCIPWMNPMSGVIWPPSERPPRRSDAEVVLEAGEDSVWRPTAGCLG